MSFWELFAALASAASIVSLAIAISSVFNGRATRRVVREISSEMQAATRDLIRSMEERMTTILERMDQRAAERHRE